MICIYIYTYSDSYLDFWNLYEVKYIYTYTYRDSQTDFLRDIDMPTYPVEVKYRIKTWKYGHIDINLSINLSIYIYLSIYLSISIYLYLYL